MSANPPSSASEDFAHLLHLTAHDWRTALDRRLRPLGLSRATWMLLAFVRKLEGANQTQLADRLGLEGASVVRLVDRLEREGYVERRPGVDRRVKTVHATEKGEALSAEILRAASELRAEIFRDVDAGEIGAAHALLARLHRRLAEVA